MGELKFIPIDREQNYIDWLKYRDSGVGASDGPILLGLNPYKCNLELFHEKVEGIVNFNRHKLDLWDGLEQEPVTTKMFEYYGGTPESISKNFESNNKVRKTKGVKGYYLNSEYPNLYVSLDRIIEQYGTFKDMPTEGALELKNTKNSVLSKYENRIVPSNLVQNLIQINVMEFSFGALAYRVESDYSHGKTYEEHILTDPQNYRGVFDNVIEQLNKFWANVEEARKIYTEILHCRHEMKFRKAEALMKEFSALEPPAQNTDAYLSYYTERYRNRRVALKEIKGTEEQYLWGKQITELGREIDALQDKQRRNRIQLIQSIGDAEIVKFDGKDSISYKADVNGQRKLLIKIK